MTPIWEVHMPGKESNRPKSPYYKVELNEEKGYLEYTKDESPPVKDDAKWEAARKFAKRCDNAVYLTSKLLLQLKSDQLSEYKARRRAYILEVLKVARAGLEQGDLDGANSELDTFEWQFVDFEGPEVRQRFLYKTLTFALVLGAISLLLGLSIASVANYVTWVTNTTSMESMPPSEVTFLVGVLKALSFIFVGNCLGVVFSAFTRNFNMNFQNLGNFDAAGLRPSLRFIFVAVLSVIVATFLQQGIISICFVSYCLDESFIMNAADTGVKVVEFAVPALDPVKCIVIGIICGLADIAITRLLTDSIGKATDKTQATP
jgi:hypothetical protein